MRYSLNLTYACDWKCSYCIVETHKQPERTLVDVLENIKLIPRGSGVSLSGGEPGLMKEEDIHLILWVLVGKECPVDLLTNGLFIKKYPHLLDKVDTVHYHCVENLTDDIQFPDLDQNKFDYQLVINDNNYEYLDEFLERYPDITFSIVPSMNIEALDKRKSFEIIKKFKHRMTERSIKEFFECACDNVTYLD